MLNKHQRLFFPGLFRLKTKVRGATSDQHEHVSLKELAMKLMKRIEGKEAFFDEFKKRDTDAIIATSELMDAEITNEDQLVLVFNYSSEKYTDPAFKDKEKRKMVRVEKAKKEEQVCLGCHIMISLSPEQGDPCAYMMLMEKSIPYSIAQRLLRTIVRALTRDRTANINGENKKVYVSVSFEPFMSETLAEGLETGVLKRIEFIKDTEAEPSELDEESMVKQVKTSAHLVLLNGGQTGARAFKILRNMIWLGKKEKYNRMRLHIVEMQNERTDFADPEYDLDEINENDIEDLDFTTWSLAQKRRAAFSEDLAQAPERIVAAVKVEMARMMVTEKSARAKK